jgi:hypothetical protein
MQKINKFFYFKPIYKLLQIKKAELVFTGSAF